MQGFNHIAGGMVFTGIFASFHDVNVFERPEYIAVTVGAALLPDIDHTRSLIGKMFYPLAKWLSVKFGHRTVTHSLVFYIGILFTVKLLEIFYGSNTNTYSILTAYALLSHLVFDMCTRQGIPFFYPFSSRPCVIPGNPSMRLRTNDLRSEAVIFVLFCALILFCWPLFGAGFWQKYNETFMNYSHIQREARRKDDILQITFLNANKDTITANLIDFKESTFTTYRTASRTETPFAQKETPLPSETGGISPSPSGGRSGWGSHSAKDCKFLAFQHTGIPLRTNRFQVFNVSPDSIKHYLKNPLVEMQLQCTQEMYYYEGAVLKSGKTITKDYTEGFDFYIEQPDNSEQQAEIQTLQAQISQERQMYQDQLNELRREQQQIRTELIEGNRTYLRLSDFKKGKWLRQRPKLEADIRQLTTEINHLRPPNLQADYTRLHTLQESLKARKVLVSGNFVALSIPSL